jgi:hypothetical protein
MLQIDIDIKRITDKLKSRCKSNNIKLPCEIDSWHGFDSTNTKGLIKLGCLLETRGWRFIGMWPNPTGARNFHMRVARTGVYDVDQLATEIEMMKNLATEFSIEKYSDCAPQPIA